MATSASSSSIAVLGRHIATLRCQSDHLEEAGGLDQLQPGTAWSQMIDELDTLSETVMTMRPASLADAGTLALCAALDLNHLSDFDMPREDAQPIYERLLVALRGILLVLRDAGVPLDELGPIESGYEIGRSHPAIVASGDA